MNEAFTAEYAPGERRYKLFFANLKTSAAAVEVQRQDEAFLAKDGTVETRRDSPPDDGLVWGREKYIGPILLLRRGGTIAGCIGLDEFADADKLASALLTRAAALKAKE